MKNEFSERMSVYKVQMKEQLMKEMQPVQRGPTEAQISELRRSLREEAMKEALARKKEWQQQTKSETEARLLQQMQNALKSMDNDYQVARARLIQKHQRHLLTACKASGKGMTVISTGADVEMIMG